MASIPLPALATQPPAQAPNALEQYARIMQLKQQQAMLPGQMQAQQQQLKAGDLENQARQRDIDQTTAVNSAYHDAITQDENGNAKIDTGKLTDALAKSNHGAAIPGIIKNINDYQKSAADLQKTQQETQSAARDSMGFLGSAIQKANYDPQLADVMIEQRLRQPGVPQQEQIQLTQVRQAMQQNPQLIKTWADSAVSQSPKVAEANKENAQATNDNAQAAKATTENENLQKFGGMTPAIAESRYLSIQTALNQKQPVSPVDMAFKAAYEKNKTMVPTATFNMQNGGASGTPTKPSALAQGIADGSIKWSDAVSPRTPMNVKQTILTEVKSINPNFKSSDFDVEKKVQEKYTSGNVSDQLLAINTAREHMKIFSSLADALDNNNVQAANSIGNAFGVQFGSDKATNFKIAAQAFGGEVGKALDGSHVTAGEREQAASAFNANMSPTQFRGAVKTVDNLLQGKQKAAKDALKAGMQGKANFGDQSTSGSYTPPAGAQTAVGPGGHKIVVDGGKWVDAVTGKPI